MTQRLHAKSIEDFSRAGTSSSAAVIRLKQVRSIFPTSEANWYEGIKLGLYPGAIRIGKRAVGWRRSDVLALIKVDTS